MCKAENQAVEMTNKAIMLYTLNQSLFAVDRKHLMCEQQLFFQLFLYPLTLHKDTKV